jgi:hypothetical protein
VRAYRHAPQVLGQDGSFEANCTLTHIVVIDLAECKWEVRFWLGISSYLGDFAYLREGVSEGGIAEFSDALDEHQERLREVSVRCLEVMHRREEERDLDERNLRRKKLETKET